jgi:hypothetical protein
LTELPLSLQSVATNTNPRQVFGVKNDKTIVLLTSNGRTEDDFGLTSAQTAQIMLGLGCVNVWNLGGGGDVNLTYKGAKLNNNIDDDLTSDRFVRFTLNVKNPIINKNIADATAQAGVVKQDIISYLINKSRSFIFSTSIPPINIAWTNWLLTEKIEYLKTQKDKLNKLYTEVHKLINNTPSKTHIIPIIIGSNEDTLKLACKTSLKSNQLLDMGDIDSAKKMVSMYD